MANWGLQGPGELLCARITRDNSVTVLTNGEQFYNAELDAIAAANTSVDLEAYIFKKGEIAGRFLELLAKKARSGVRVNLLLDAVGSAATFRSYLRPLLDAGGKFAWYHPLWWHTIPAFNNRTHRELLVVDGKVGFIGGAGIADHWYKARGKNPRWRDTMLRVEGGAVEALQATFAENWLESCSELLVGPQYFPQDQPKNGDSEALVVTSTPSAGGASRARILVQLLLSSAQESIHITTPYFLPDSSAREALTRAAKERGVDVRIVVPGHRSDHFQTYHSTQRFYGLLLRAGARIFEYQPAMIHAKIMIIDGQWCVAGSTNFDSRSFSLNDEVNIAVRDRELAQRLAQDFARDVANSREVTYEHWRRRSLLQRLDEVMAMVLERQE
jgi:cardiolipin synthase